ncbi:MAG: PSD1 and planctomycete cytochrome C domain-containing protein [Planctomycetaceae bacterium]
MPRFNVFLVVTIATGWCWGISTKSHAEDATFSPEKIEYFEKEVRPLLVEHCLKCHGDEKQKGDLRLDSREAALKGGETSPAIVPGKPDESELIKALRYDPDGYQMPPEGKLPPETVAIFVKWVEMGAPWPASNAPASGPPTRDRLAAVGPEEFAKRAERFAFQPLQRTPPPVVKNTDWSRTPIDRFLLAKIEEAGLAPAPETDRRTWIRRAYFDTIGLPPSPEAVDAFVADTAPDAHEKVIDELLASPRFGERWGRHWLDLARYAESRGHEFDYDVPNPWHYRDYVIAALNSDIPYDQFVAEHVAGDLLEEGRSIAGQEHRFSSTQPVPHHPSLATGYWFLGEWVHSPVDIRKDETDRLDNMIEVYSKTFLGLTISCARCHDHKFDPISQKDYYALAGYLKSTSYAQRPFETLTHNRQIQSQLSDLYAQAAGPIEATTRKAIEPIRPQLNHYLLAAREVLATTLSRGAAGNDIDFDDFEGGTYSGWEITGDAFGTKPQTQSTIGDYQGNVQANGKFFINTHQLRDGGKGDNHVGTMTSREFPIEHDMLKFLIGGGPHVGKTCINLLIDGKVVLSATGHSSNIMRAESWDLSPFKGQTARLQIVDEERGGWGNIGIDYLRFSDSPLRQVESPEIHARVQQTAAQRQLQPEILAAWVKYAVQAASDASSPFHSWAKFAAGQAPFPTTKANATLPATAQPIPFLNQDGVYYSFPRPGHQPRIWLSDNPEQPLAQVATNPMAIQIDADFANIKESEGTMRDGGSLGPMGRAGRTLRTTSFEITTGRIAAWVRGGCATYVVVDSHSLVLGPLHGTLVRKQKSAPEWHWVEHDVARYKGHQAHLEIVAEAGTDFACEEAYQVEEVPGPLPIAGASELLNSSPSSPLSGQSLQLVLNHPELFGLNTPEFKHQLAEVSTPFIEQRKTLVSRIETTSAAAPEMLEGSAADEALLIRGNSNKPVAKVPRRFIEVFHGTGPDEKESGSGRLGLARQMIDPDQTPIVPRVLVNRIWHHYFGRGIVPTTDDFGHMGQLPSHPELLDWLATELIREEWSQKQIHRLILLSAAYRMSSEKPVDQSASDPDPNNLLLSRMPIKRLEGEVIRDSILDLSGRMDDRLYGPSVPIALNAFQDGRGKPSVSGPIDGAGRRSLYLSVRRNFADSFLTAFDMPNPHTSMGRRNVSNVPAQALALLNSPMVTEQARLWAEQSLRLSPQKSTSERVDDLYLQAYSRLPAPEEREAALQFIQATTTDLGVAETDAQVWAELCHVLINAKEFIYIR